MKVLFIGKSGIVQRSTVPNDFIRSIELVELPMGLSTEEYIAGAGDADFIISDAMTAVPAELINAMPKLRLIHSNGVGYNFVDCAAARARGIPVCNCQGMNAKAVAEHAIMLMLMVLRGGVTGDRATRCGRQGEVKMGYMVRGDLRELSDCSVGLVGFGDIARETARLLKAFGVENIYYNKRRPLPPQEEEALGVKYLPLEELLSVSDIVSLHTPVTPETERMADDAFFAMMHGGCLINTARGELVDDSALIRALENGNVSMAGLDTLDMEPTQADHPLVTLRPELADRLVLSPHIAGVTASSFKRGFAMIWENIERVANGEEPMNVVNR